MAFDIKLPSLIFLQISQAISVLLEILFYKLYLDTINFNSYTMKMKYILGLLVLFLFSLSSCKKELEPQDSSVSATPSTTNTSVATPNSSNMTNAPQNANSSQVNPQGTLAGMNPPHGQAGHRCDIAVGAPLNSPPGKQASIPNPAAVGTGTKISAPTIIKSDAAAIVTKPGMNPPHGQAGHRCDIAVGAPLNSPTSKDAAAPATTNSNPQVPAVLKLDTTAVTPK